MGPESVRLNTLTRGVQKAAKWHRQVSWLRAFAVEASREALAAILITVARPRGIHTRFPILPAMGAPDTLI